MSQPIYNYPVLLPSLSGLESVTGLAQQRAQRADVVLGMPKQECRFHGICRVEPHQSVAVGKRKAFCQSETVPGWLLRPEPNYCVLLIEKDSLVEDREAYHFARPAIEINKSLDVTQFYAVDEGKKFLLRSGKYPLLRTQGYYALHLPLFTQSLLPAKSRL